MSLIPATEPGAASASTPLLPKYAELHCHTNFSFLQGASHAEELVARASQLDYAALAITDECSLAGIVRAHVACKELAEQGGKLRLLVGSYFKLVNAAGQPALSLIVIAQNLNGYGNLCELITLARTRIAKGSYWLTPHDLERPEPPYAHLRGLPDCLVILDPAYGVEPERLSVQAQWVEQLFPQRAYMALTQLHRARDALHAVTVCNVAADTQLPVVATGQVCMHVRSRKDLHDTLTSIRLGKPLQECGFELAPNAEQHLRQRIRLSTLYPPDTLARTVELAARCSFDLKQIEYEYPDEVVPPGATPASYLRAETYLGAHRRFPNGIPSAVQEQLENELELIGEMKYESYFLTVYDIVRFARSQHILCQGRGSAANSVVCYCLGITEVDPARSQLLFGRFISKERGEPPDIDVDFEHQRREEVMQYIYRKYGRARAALSAAVISYRSRSALRDVGKALGVDPALVDQVAKSHQHWDGKSGLAARFADNGIDPETSVARLWISLTDTLRGFPRHLSQHVGGFVISRGQLSRLVPVENAAMPERSIIQWDKDDLEALGLMKVDVLALGMLSAIRRTLDFVSARRGEPLEMADIRDGDDPTYDMICAADTIGVFQIESRAQMTMLPRLRPRVFYDLVIEVSIIRPGPIQGGMVHPFLRRRQKLEPVTYPSPAMETALSRTMGVPIFQEQVMQVAMLGAGFSAGEADQLRRSMAAWKRKGGLFQYYDKIINGLTENGYPREFAESIFKQIEGFGEYGFPESHAASFALLVYTSSWLKCHEPAAFLAGLLNSQPMGFYSPSVLIQDAQRHGVEVRAADVTLSDWEATLEQPRRCAGSPASAPCSTSAANLANPAVRLGLNQIRGMRQDAAWRIEEARAIRPFVDTADLALRAQLDRHDLQVLAASGALATLAGHRRAALWQAVVSVPERDLLRGSQIIETTPVLRAPSEGQGIVDDYRLLGLTLARHPLALLRGRLTAQRFVAAAVLNTYRNGQLARGCGIVTVRQRPGTAKGVIFMTLEDETGPINVIIWPKVLERQRKEVLGAALLGVYGVWQSHSQVRHLVAQRLVDLSPLLGRLATESRDFC